MVNKHKTIISLCDYSGNWSKPYKNNGYNVIQLDLKFGHDVRLIKRSDLPPKIHGILAAPPCTEFASSGARWWKTKGEQALLDGLSIIDACMRIILITNPVWWALENPVGRLKHYLGNPAYIFDPCDFGDPYTKKTLLWGNFTPPIGLFIKHNNWQVEPTEGSKMWAKYGGKSDKTKEARSKTPEGFARAFFLANP